ncbi:hypothetical protein PQV03_10075 [Thermoanaerobacterium thermosaccharolyticum]|uniref:phage late control D family protein n=1 Tax=Thermoanaerobacterium thermosaccharolyticum TaxID=1517 RepID=UPI003D2A3C7B
MNIIYEGVDITDSIDIRKADIYDNAGGIADSVYLIFSDIEGSWSKWKPQKGDKIEVRQDGFSSGIMYIDQIEQKRGYFILKALSIPLNAKTQNTKSWENIRFLSLAKEMADKYSFELQTYNIQNWHYDRLDQVEQTDFDFLAYRCMLEGYMLKICNQSLIIYDEKYMEQQDSVKVINIEDIDGDYLFKIKSNDLYSSCNIQYNGPNGLIKSVFKPSNAPIGPEKKIQNIYLFNQGEADRYAKNILRNFNKYENTGRIQTKLDTCIAAGNSVNINGINISNGKYFISQAVYKLLEEKMQLTLRKPLEGY